MIIVTPNPALDRTVFVPALKAGEVNRATETRVTAGGKGINAARAMKTLGGSALCMGFIGGRNGNWFARLAEAEHFRTAWTRMNGETRTNLILVAAGGETTVVNEPGPVVDRGSWDTLHTDVLATYKMHTGKKVSHLVAFCGSLPPESPLEAFTQLVFDLRKVGAHVWVDTSGPALEAALKATPVGVKINLAEASAAVGRSLSTPNQIRAAAHEIQARGIEFVVITLGAEGAVLVNGDGAWQATPPPIRSINNLGSGDSFFGAFLLGLEKYLPAAEVLRQGVAAGTANALSTGNALFSMGDFEKVLSETRVTSLI
jgi:1-phosphofructokinase family hexose kinase